VGRGPGRHGTETARGGRDSDAGALLR